MKQMRNAQKERLIQVLASHCDTVHETFQAFDSALVPSLEKASWGDVVKMGDHFSKQATIVGILWAGGNPDQKSVEENMESFFNALRTLLLLAHGSSVGAGRTLSANIHHAFKQIVDSSFKLMAESVSSFGSHGRVTNNTVPQLVGAVWDACSALKKTPSTNITAIGRELTKIAVSVKDVLREMQELKMEDNPKTNENATDGYHDDDSFSNDGDFGNDLSPNEMRIAQAAMGVVSEVLLFIKELIRTISSSIKQESPADNGRFVDSLENLLILCKDVGEQMDELGVCLYPPQEASTMTILLKKISGTAQEISQVVNTLGSSSDISPALDRLNVSLRSMESEVKCINVHNLQSEVQGISLID